MTVGMEMNAIVICSLMLASVVKVAKTYITDQEEFEFMEACRKFVQHHQLGHRPPAPRRTFSTHWTQRCDRHWKRGFRLFVAGVLFCLINLAVSSWIKFKNQNRIAAVMVTIIIGVALIALWLIQSRYAFDVLRAWLSL